MDESGPGGDSELPVAVGVHPANRAGEPAPLHALVFGSELGGLSAGIASYRRRGVEGADEVQQAYAIGEFGVDGGVEVLDAVEPEQHGIAGVVVGHPEASQRPVYGVHHHGMFDPFLGAGEETLPQGGVDSRVWVPRGGTGQSGSLEVAGVHGGEAFGCGPQEACLSPLPDGRRGWRTRGRWIAGRPGAVSGRVGGRREASDRERPCPDRPGR
ncbi:MAG: hypothetical protein CM1200mP26_12890 [Acidimicrobiales bacterium]|nr:MAG: hypothetical protein CM1200mP26_12890 [Acidimicrobiales bacterium]